MADFKDKDEVAAAIRKSGGDNSWMYPDGETPVTFRDEAPLPPPVSPATPEPMMSTQPVSYESSQSTSEPTRQTTPEPEPPTVESAPTPPPVAKPAHRAPAASKAGEPSLESYLKPEYQHGKNPGAAPAAAEESAEAIGQRIMQENDTKDGTAPEAAPPTAQSAGVEDLAWNPSDKTKDLRAQKAVGDQRGLDLVQEGIDQKEKYGHDIDAIDSGRVAEAGKQKQAIADRTASEDARAEDMRARQESQLSELKTKMGRPPFDTVGLVFGIVSALAASKGKEGLANAFSALGQAVNVKMKNWHGSIEAGQDNLQGMGKLVNADRLMNADHHEAQHELATAVAAEFDAAADQVITHAKTDEQVKAGEALKLKIRQSLDQTELSRRQAAAAAEHKRKAYQAIGGAQTQEERDLAERKYGELGQKVGRDILKTQGDRAKLNDEMVGTELKGAQIDDTQAATGLKGAQAAKTMAEAEAKASGGPGGPVVGGYNIPTNLPSAAVTKIVDGGMALGRVNGYYKRLAEIAQDVQSGKISKIDANTSREVADIRNGLVGLRTNLNGAGAPTGKEYDDTIATIADPQAMFQRADSLQLLKRAGKNLNAAWGSAMANIGATPATAGQPAPRQAASSNVKMLDPNGESVEIPSTAVDALMKTNPGYKLVDDSEPLP